MSGSPPRRSNPPPACKGGALRNARIYEKLYNGKDCKEAPVHCQWARRIAQAVSSPFRAACRFLFAPRILLPSAARRHNLLRDVIIYIEWRNPEATAGRTAATAHGPLTRRFLSLLRHEGRPVGVFLPMPVSAAAIRVF